MLKRLFLVLALVVGAFAFAPSASKASPLGASAHVEQTLPTVTQKAYYYYYRRPRYYYRPRYYRPYYRPRYYYYRPRRHYYYYRRW